MIQLIRRASDAARIAAPRGPWHDREYRHTFADGDIDRITGALGWVLAAADLHDVEARRSIARLSNRDDALPYHLWPRLIVDGAELIEPDLEVLRALDAACSAITADSAVCVPA